MSETTNQSTFTHVNLNEVDPNSRSIPDGVYNFKIGKAEVKSYNPKGQPEGSGEYINLRLLVTDSPDYSGRAIFSALFPGDITNQKLRKLMDATGVPVSGEFQDSADVVAWLDTVRTEGATFSAGLATKPRLNKKTGQMEDRQELNGFSFAPAQ